MVCLPFVMTRERPNTYLISNIHLNNAFLSQRSVYRGSQILSLVRKQRQHLRLKTTKGEGKTSMDALLVGNDLLYV